MFANKVKKVAAIHDLSGMGRVSLTVVIPILSSMGFQVCPLPTAILSNHTQYPDFTFLDLTDEMPRIIAEWKRLEVEFDAIYTGYLGSPRQIQIVSDFIRDFRRKDSLTVIDPVLGDNGKLYSNFNESMVAEMQHLVTHADVITPNLTELFYLLDRPYKESNTDQELKEYLRCLSDKGPEVVIITGVGRTPQNFCLCLQSDRKPLLENHMSLFARPLSGYGRYVYECHYRSFIAGRQSSYCSGSCYAVYFAGHSCYFRLRVRQS
jgi:pyridoxine kinase